MWRRPRCTDCRYRPGRHLRVESCAAGSTPPHTPATGAVVVAELHPDCQPTLRLGSPSNPGGHAQPGRSPGVGDLEVDVAIAPARWSVRDDLAFATLSSPPDIGFGPRGRRSGRRGVGYVAVVLAVDDGWLPPPAAYPKRARKSMKMMNPKAVFSASSAMLCLDQYGAKLLTIALQDETSCKTIVWPCFAAIKPSCKTL